MKRIYILKKKITAQQLNGHVPCKHDILIIIFQYLIEFTWFLSLYFVRFHLKFEVHHFIYHRQLII